MSWKQEDSQKLESEKSTEKNLKSNILKVFKNAKVSAYYLPWREGWFSLVRTIIFTTFWIIDFILWKLHFDLDDLQDPFAGEN